MMSGISSEVLTTLKEMAKAKKPEDKLAYSKAVKNLCESLEVFLNLMSDMDLYDDDDDYDDDGEPLPF